jgi:hypothetical protein
MKGDIRCRAEVSKRLAHDARQGAHVRKVMESYQTWFGEGPELSLLRMLGLFDRPADEKALGALLKSPAIPGLTESLTNLSPTEWRTILARIRRARLLAGEDPHNPTQNTAAKKRACQEDVDSDYLFVDAKKKARRLV